MPASLSYLDRHGASGRAEAARGWCSTTCARPSADAYAGPRRNDQPARALVAPCTTTIRGLVSEVVLDVADDPVPRRSAVNLDSVESVSIAVLVTRLGRLSDTRLRDVCAALAVPIDCSD